MIGLSWAAQLIAGEPAVEDLKPKRASDAVRDGCLPVRRDHTPRGLGDGGRQPHGT
jgi:hypothetical protein